MAQNTLTQTTLAAAVDASSNIVQVASATGITVAQNTTATLIYVDRELMTVLNVNGTELTVARGANGTPAAGHASGAMVLAGDPIYFIDHDPQGTTSNALVTPLVNTMTGRQWLLSSVTGTWVPGFGNSSQALGETASVTGATVTPSGPLEQFTGTTELETISLPIGGAGLNACQVTLIFTGSSAGLTWGTSGNIALAGSVSAGSAVTFTYLPSTSKWYPSKTA